MTVVKADGSTKPSSFTVTVPKNGKLEDLTQALSTACSLGVDETLLVAEVTTSITLLSRCSVGLPNIILVS